MDMVAFQYAVVGAFQTLWSSFSFKALLAAVIALILHKHSVLFIAFTLLVFLDCFTKWLELSSKNLKSGGVKNPTLIQAFLNIRKARRTGAISSEVMKHRFLGKIFIYFICALSAGVVDIVMLYLGKQGWAVEVAISYLTAIELLSIVENLSSAGVEQLAALANLVKKKLT